MTEKINIAKLLKNCPKDMELNCLMYEDVYFDYVDALNIIHCYIQHKAHKTYLMFNQHGTPNSDIKSKCVIFPKGKTTWEGFVPPCMFKDGDVAITYMGDIHLCRTEDSSYCACRMPYARLPRFDSTITTGVKFIRLATEKEKQKLFDAIKDNGYHWDAETKTLEEFVKPKFKVGDRIRSIISNSGYIYNVIEVKESLYVVSKNNEYDNKLIDFKIQDYWELVPNKFDITTLVPFESKVLVRDNVDEVWLPCFFGGICNNDNKYSYRIVGGERWNCCIPYEGNEHLLNTPDDCEEYFKTW